MSLYLGYDRAALDAQYFLRGRVPDFQDYFDRYRQWSDQAKRELGATLDIAYGPSPAETLDIFPCADHGRPVHVFIHGGYWQAMDKADFAFVAYGFRPKNAVTVTVNYALAPTVRMDEIVRQNRAALAWVWRNAPRFGGDPNRIHVSGHSAGGHLTAMMCLTDWPSFAPGLPKDLVKGGLAISGLFDLEPVRLCYLNDKLGLDAAEARRNSPIHLLPATAPELLFCVGDAETDEFLRQQAEFLAAWRARGLPAREIPAPGLHHFSVIEALAKPGTALNEAAIHQMGL